MPNDQPAASGLPAGQAPMDDRIRVTVTQNELGRIVLGLYMLESLDTEPTPQPAVDLSRRLQDRYDHHRHIHERKEQHGTT